MVAVRTAGLKIISRFVYTVIQNPRNCPESFICLPYGDASKANVLHIYQILKPILQADVPNLVKGEFELLINLPDAYESIKTGQNIVYVWLIITFGKKQLDTIS